MEGASRGGLHECDDRRLEPAGRADAVCPLPDRRPGEPGRVRRSGAEELVELRRDPVQARLGPDLGQERLHLRVEERPEVRLLDPEVADRLLRVVAVEGAGEADAVDPAGGRPGDDVDADLDPVGIAVRGGVRLERLDQARVDRGRPRRRARIRLEAKRGGRHELLDLARDPAHVDRERHAAVADERQPDLERFGSVGSHETPLSDGRGRRGGQGSGAPPRRAGARRRSRGRRPLRSHPPGGARAGRGRPPRAPCSRARAPRRARPARW